MAIIQPRHGSPFNRDRDTPSPHTAPQPALTKRDVRRNRMIEKLQEMMDSFSNNQHHHYRAQLQAVQVDMNLILRADPYEGAPLEDGGGELRGMIEELGAGLGVGDGAEMDEAQQDFWAMAGNRYRTFVREANDAIEKRDADLTALHNWYDSSIAEVERLTQQRIHQAEEEHKALASTIRQRLTTTISKRRAQLLRDKEQLDIADSSALLLHPSQFTLNNPGSPGTSNGAPNRKTRHLRHRAISPIDDPSKRKRKAAADDDNGNESPAPAYRFPTLPPPPDNLGGGRSPLRDAREKNSYTQFEAPAYSLERLFTDKELALATDTAKMATYRYFHHPHPPTTDPTTAAPSLDDPALTSLDTNTNTIDPDSQPPSPPPDMARESSHQVLTRNSARANPLAALSDLASAAAAAGRQDASGAVFRANPFAPVVPSFHAVTRSEKSGAPAPLGVGGVEMEGDFELMRRVGGDELNNGDVGGDTGMGEASATELRSSLLDQALRSVGTGVGAPYRLPLMETGPAVVGRGVERVPATGFAPVAAVSEMRGKVVGPGGGSLGAAFRANGGFGVGGGEAMSRTTSAAESEAGVGIRGGEAMGRTASRRGRLGKLV